MNAQGKSNIGPVLLIGASGMLGRAWRELLTSRHIEFAAPTHGEFDLTNPDLAANHIINRFRFVINCAAWTDVDGAEANPAAAEALNVDALHTLGLWCAHAGATLVHYSTDYVFDGQATQPYSIDAPGRPQNVYGRTKAQGEVEIFASGCNFLIIRTSWLYASWGKNFVRTILKLAGKRPELQVVNDQRGRPTSCRHLAQVTFDLLQAKTANISHGVYHVTDGGECTWFDFARESVRLAHLPCKVLPCTTADFPRPAKRPAYSVLDISATEKLVGPMPNWKINLAHVIQHMEPL